MKELEDENGKSGNYGYYDQQAAIAGCGTTSKALR